MDTKQIQKFKESSHTRLFRLDHNGIDVDNFTIPASLSSSTPIKRSFFGDVFEEVLIHTKAAIDLTIAGSARGLPLHFGHAPDGRTRGPLIGRARDIKLKKGRLEAVLHFSQNTQAGREAWEDVREEFLTDISIGYSIEETRETVSDKNTVIEATKWTPREASIVTVPADNSIGINRTEPNLEGRTMLDEDGNEIIPAAAPGTAPVAAPGTAPGPKPAPISIEGYETARKSAGTEGEARGIETERKRVADITRLFDLHATRNGVAELRSTCLASDVAAARAGELLVEFLAGDPAPATLPVHQSEGSHGARIESGEDESDKWIKGITESIECRAGLITDREKRREAQRSEYHGMSLGDMARAYLIRQRVSLSGLTRIDIAGQAFTRAGQHGTSDFSNVLENVANKSLMIGYDQAPETWRLWCRIGSLADFKVASRVNLSSFSDLELILESGEYKEGHVSDLKETIQLAKYGKTFTISREAIINDDLDVFTGTPRNMGLAASRVIGDLAYNILINNPTLNQDSVVVFHSNHSNLGSAGAITETTLDEFGKLMAAQTSPNPAPGETGAVLNLAPSFLLVPRAILMTARKVVDTPTAPDTTGDLTVNTARNAWTIVWDARLDADSIAQYYGLADPAVADTIEVAFLDGNDQPFIESQNGFTQDGVKYKVRIEGAAAARDFRGMVRNAGA
ncbi:MAG: HK97 family phage prohead protease [Proteobacteria bacterium]|nr:HK97 family phage prohead protease [Pseudomonadota bacterium]